MQILINGLISGATVALLALAFATVYLPTRVSHIALAGVYAFAPYVMLMFLRRMSVQGGQAELHQLLTLEAHSVSDPQATSEQGQASIERLTKVFRLLGNGHEHGVDRLFYAYQEQAGGIAEDDVGEEGGGTADVHELGEKRPAGAEGGEVAGRKVLPIHNFAPLPGRPTQGATPPRRGGQRRGP